MAFVISENVRDRKAEVEGTWFEYDEGVRLLVARNNNPAYKLFIKKKYSANESTIKKDNLHATKVAEELMTEAIANHIVLNWEGFVDGNGKEIKYTPAVGKALLEEHDDLKDAIMDFSSARDNYIIQQEEEALDGLKK